MKKSKQSLFDPLAPAVTRVSICSICLFDLFKSAMTSHCLATGAPFIRLPNGRCALQPLSGTMNTPWPSEAATKFSNQFATIELMVSIDELHLMKAESLSVFCLISSDLANSHLYYKFVSSNHWSPMAPIKCMPSSPLL